MKKTVKGFSLIELLTVVVAIGMFICFIGLAFSGVSPQLTPLLGKKLIVSYKQKTKTNPTP